MIKIRKTGDRGYFDHGWLKTYHSFSFDAYYDPAHMGFRSLRVINEDWVQAGRGFPTHGHRDMEIVTYVLEGELEHKDSMGNGSIIRPGDIQKMSAGTGVTHSEYNPSSVNPVHLLQIWILPARRGITPSYEQKSFSRLERSGTLRLIASSDGREGTITIQQDARIYSSILAAGEEVISGLEPERGAWLHVARGGLSLNGQPLQQGDGASVAGENSLRIVAGLDSEFLLFDLA